jgi:N-acetylmuramoyl-L-alanine amidase
MRRPILFLIFLTCFAFVDLTAANKRFVVVIDPGHGGKDHGAVRGQYKEKEINLGVALKLGGYIERNFSDVEVVYTRRADVFVELDERASIANRAKANLFISIHTNSTESASTSASGAETYILGLARSKENLEVAKRENSVILLEDNYSRKYEGFDPKSPESYIIFEFMTNKYMEQSYEMASYLQHEFPKTTNQSDKGVRQAGFLVLRKTSMPSMLVELGFINNQRDAAYISSDSGQADLAQAIYNAFKKYKREFEKKQGFVVTEKDDLSQHNVKDLDSTVSSSHLPSSPTALKVRATERPKSSTSKNNDKAVTNRVSIEYRVQFLTSPSLLSKNSPMLKGLSPVESYQERGLHKYTYGASADLSEIIRIQREVRKKFKDAFVVKFINGEKAN